MAPPLSALRPNTPPALFPSSDDDLGFVELVIKVYFRGVNEKFPDGGVMSQHMETLKVGDKVRFVWTHAVTDTQL